MKTYRRQGGKEKCISFGFALADSKTIEKMQGRSFLRWGWKARSREEKEKRSERGLALLTMLMAFNVLKEERVGRCSRAFGGKRGRNRSVCWKELESEKNERPTFVSWCEDRNG